MRQALSLALEVQEGPRAAKVCAPLGSPGRKVWKAHTCTVVTGEAKGVSDGKAGEWLVTGAFGVLEFNPAKGDGESGIDTDSNLFGSEGSQASFSECHVTDRQQRGCQGPGGGRGGTKAGTGEAL